MAAITHSILADLSAQRRSAQAETDEKVLAALRSNIGPRNVEDISHNVLRRYGRKSIRMTESLLDRLVREGRATCTRAALKSPERGRKYYEAAPR